MKYLNDVSYKDCVGKVCKSKPSMLISKLKKLLLKNKLISGNHRLMKELTML